jgi:hypothetical protein
MVLDNKVSIPIMFCVMFHGFISFDILVVLKNMFLPSFLHVFVMFFKVSFSVLYNKVL